MFSNIGGTATAIGDPPNVIIVANGDLQDEVRHVEIYLDEPWNCSPKNKRQSRVYDFSCDVLAALCHLYLQTDGKLNFATFTLHMTLGTIFVMIACYILLRLMYWKKELLKADDPPEVAGIVSRFKI